MQEIHKLRSQVSRIVQTTYPGIDAGFIPKLQPPSETQVRPSSSPALAQPNAHLCADQGPPSAHHVGLYRPSRRPQGPSRQILLHLLRQSRLDSRSPLPLVRDRRRLVHPPQLRTVPQLSPRIHRLPRPAPHTQSLAQKYAPLSPPRSVANPPNSNHQDQPRLAPDARQASLHVQQTSRDAPHRARSEEGRCARVQERGYEADVRRAALWGGHGD